MEFPTSTLELACDALAPHRGSALPMGDASDKRPDLLCRLGLHEWTPWSAPFSLGGPILIQSRCCERCGTERRHYE